MEDCAHVWYTKGCESCEERGHRPHALTDGLGMCYICGEKHDDSSVDTRGPMGTFSFDGELFCWGPHEKIVGLTVVLDNQDTVIATGVSGDDAVEVALYRLEAIRDIVDTFLQETFGDES
jgi:hypothetical protein